jgi:hypothetical protein
VVDPVVVCVVEPDCVVDPVSVDDEDDEEPNTVVAPVVVDPDCVVVPVVVCVEEPISVDDDEEDEPNKVVDPN